MNDRPPLDYATPRPDHDPDPDPAWLDRSLALLESAGRRPYLVLDGREVEQFRKRFAGSVAGALDQAPIATLNGVVFVYDPLNRQPGGSLAIGATRRSRSLLACDTPSTCLRSAG